ncbi:MAG TPA: ATP-dependent Clp protease adaptor ClpS, partial [Caldilineaceae bacterium]|nr:ATP-dependent Clp protease adaptor ClpS [Caldilineaceae bacterium]
AHLSMPLAVLLAERVLDPPAREADELDEALARELDEVLDEEIDEEIDEESVEGSDEAAANEPLYQVLIHNDDVTPYDYVVRILQRIFLLSEELAEHVAWTAHHEEVAVVVIRPKAEAQKLITVARAHARMDGYPLTFSMERVD